jgi:hypothetical protein
LQSSKCNREIEIVCPVDALTLIVEARRA